MTVYFNPMSIKLSRFLLALSLLPLRAWAVDIEPANWWVGFREPHVQLLLHEAGIGHSQVALQAADVKVTRVERTDNDNYLFVTLTIGPGQPAGTIQIELTDTRGAKRAVPYELRERRPGSALRQGFDNTDAVYLLMPDRFVNADPANDTQPGMLEPADPNAPYGRHGGDLKGVTEHLDYIAGLGMTALWMTPFLENDMPQSSYHGYAITDYYRVDRRLGSLDDLKRLSDELHKRGMKHIMDMVFNHCGTNHRWLRDHDLPSADWINVWKDAKGLPTFVRSNYRLSAVLDPNASQRDRDLALKGWFDTTMADLNLSNPLVANYLIQNSIWWIETADLDGIRQDTYPYSDPEAMRRWNERIYKEYPLFNIVGEIWLSEASKVAPWQTGWRGGFDSGLRSVMDFPLQERLCGALKEGGAEGANRLYESFANDHLYPDPRHVLIFGENHDTGRLFTQLGDDADAARLAYALLATARGIPQLYYGSEALMAGNGFDGHANIRRDFPVEYFQKMPDGPRQMRDYVARLFNFRKTSKALLRGSMTQYIPQSGLYVFFRTDAASGERVLTALNLDREERTLDPADFPEMSGAALAYDVLTEGKRDVAKPFKVPARHAAVIAF